jgi:hypothetical protein
MHGTRSLLYFRKHDVISFCLPTQYYYCAYLSFTQTDKLVYDRGSKPVGVSSLGEACDVRAGSEFWTPSW